MQTPIQKLISWVDEVSNSIFALQSSDIELKMLSQFKAKLLSELPYEQECIENAYIECWMNDGGNGITKVKEANEYFTKTFNTTPIVFDAKIEAEKMYNEFWHKAELKEDEAFACVQIALTYSHYTQSQREAIINELNKM